jgi:phage-related protein
MADFPTFGNKEDSSKFGLDLENVGIRSEMEGGYVLTRPRHTRRPRRTWSTGFTDLSEAQKTTFETFFNEHGTFKVFTYTVKTSNEVVQVRFASVPSFDYKGYGTNYRWDIGSIKLEEV